MADNTTSESLGTMWWAKEAAGRYCHNEHRPAKPDTRTWKGKVLWVDRRVRQWADAFTRTGLFRVLEHAGKFAILLAAVAFFVDNLPWVKKKQQIRDAWTVVTSQEGKLSSGGRVEALETLHTYGVSLAGLSAPSAYLGGLCMPEAELPDAHFRNTTLIGADLRDVNLSRANLVGADLRRANLTGAVLEDTNLENADLSSAVGVTEEQLSSARVDGTTKLPIPRR